MTAEKPEAAAATGGESQPVPGEFTSTGDLQAALQAAEAARDDFQDKWTRSRADLENYRRRMQRELEEERKFAAVPLLKAFLPGLDNLHRALKAAGTSRNIDELISGIELVARQFESAMLNVGVQPIAAEGTPFDPQIHEAISQVPSADYPPMTVLQEVERGYMLQERVLRPTKVIVTSAPPAAPAPSAGA
jgi:molecular chaperone GrpE